MLQAENEASLRQEQIRQLSAMLKGLDGSYIDNRNGTVTDRRTGLIWSVFQIGPGGSPCVSLGEALRHVKQLEIAGYRNWRIPSVEELQAILQNEPVFPADRTHFFWTSERFWHGWNEMSFVFSPSNQSEWKKESAGVEQCGSVLAVRNP